MEKNWNFPPTSFSWLKECKSGTLSWIDVEKLIPIVLPRMKRMGGTEVSTKLVPDLVPFVWEFTGFYGTS